MKSVIKLILVVIIPFLLQSCKLHQKAKTENPIQVKVIEATTVTGIQTTCYIGKAEAAKSVIISGRHAGTLTELNVSQGTFVKQGQTIAVIDSRSVKSSRDMAYATLKQAEDGYQRLKKVHNTGSVADVQMIEIETQLSKARAAAEIADKAYEDCIIKAPFSGIIGEVFPVQGVELSMSEPIVTLMDISEIKICFPVPENEIGDIIPGTKAVIVVPSLSRHTDSGKDMKSSFDGTVISKGITASMLSHTYDCTLKPDMPIKGLLPGMVCKVYTENNLCNGIIVPAASVMSDENGRYVWIATDGKVEKKHIETAGFSGKGIIAVSGLSDGDKIITDGVQKVSTGMKIKVVEDYEKAQ